MRRLELRSLLSMRVWPLLRLRACMPSSQRRPLIAFQRAPFLLADRIDRLVERLDDVESINHQRRVRTVVLDRLGVGPAHVAAGPGNPLALRLGEVCGEELVDGGSPLASAGGDPIPWTVRLRYFLSSV